MNPPKPLNSKDHLLTNIMKNKKKIIRFSVWFLIFLFTGIAVAVYLWNKPHRDIRNSNGLQISATALYDSLRIGNKHSILTFNNKVVTVTGRIRKILNNRQNQQVILLQTSREGGSVNCTLEEKINSTGEGNFISLQGLCIGYSGEDTLMDLPGDVFLIRCYPLQSISK